MSDFKKLNETNLLDINSKVTIPKYNRSEIKASIAHIGVGGFHRSHQALYADRLITEHGLTDCGICGIGLLEFDRKIYDVMKSQDCLYTLVVKELNGELNARVIGSIVEFLYAPEDSNKVIEKLSSSDIKIISLTITEGGYNFSESTGEFNFENPAIKKDLANPLMPQTVFGYLAQSLKKRKENGSGGCTIQSCDNIQGNGDVCKKMLCSFIERLDINLLDWVKKNVSFPNSMVDRITPATVDADRVLVKNHFQIEDQWPVICEPFIQWVIEDDFVSGRPPWEKVGAQFVNDVVPYENMKLRLLNAGHSVLGILGALYGYQTIDQCASDVDFSKFLRAYMDIEATPVLANLEGIDLNQYKDSLIARFRNKNIKDQVSRICLSSSAKIPNFLLSVVRDQLLRSNCQIEKAAFVVAAWCKYNDGIDENGNSYKIDDQMAEVLIEAARKSHTEPLAFIQIDSVFGDLSTNKKFADAFCNSLKEIRVKKIKECVKEMNSK